MAPLAPFHLRYSLSRRQRLVTELPPWVPAIAGSLGFATGIAVLAVHVSLVFLVLLVLPLLIYRGLFALLMDLAIHPHQLVEILVDEIMLEFLTSGKPLVLPLDGIIQVFRSGDNWTVLHLDGSSLTIPADAITGDQIDYLKSFARHAAAERRAAQSEH